MTLKTLRDDRVLSQTDVANAVGVSSATVSRWEAGTRRPSRVHIHKLAKLYEIEPKEMLRIVEESATYSVEPKPTEEEQ